MKYKKNAIKITLALSIVGIIGMQIPVRGEFAIGAFTQPSDSYPDNGTENFLGIKGTSNKDTISGLAIGALGIAAYSAMSDARARALERSSLLPGVDRSKMSIYNVLKSMPDDFSEIVKLIDSAQLQSTLREDGPYTFLAPNNAALSLLSTIERAELENPSNKDALILWIKRHIVVGRHRISQLFALKDGSSLPTLSGESIAVNNLDGSLSLDGTMVIQNDIQASNGWIHPINKAMEDKAPMDK